MSDLYSRIVLTYGFTFTRTQWGTVRVYWSKRPDGSVSSAIDIVEQFLNSLDKLDLVPYDEESYLQ